MTYYNFIGIYDNALPNEQCQIIIDEFDVNARFVAGWWCSGIRWTRWNNGDDALFTNNSGDVRIFYTSSNS